VVVVVVVVVRVVSLVVSVDPPVVSSVVPLSAVPSVALVPESVVESVESLPELPLSPEFSPDVPPDVLAGEGAAGFAPGSVWQFGPVNELVQTQEHLDAMEHPTQVAVFPSEEYTPEGVPSF